MRNLHEQRTLAGDEAVGRTMFIDTGSAVAHADFGIGPVARQALFQAGRRSAADFLAGTPSPVARVRTNVGA
jgi:hypothetical protein